MTGKTKRPSSKAARPQKREKKSKAKGKPWAEMLGNRNDKNCKKVRHRPKWSEWAAILTCAKQRVNKNHVSG